MGWLKRVFGSTDAMAETRAEAARDDGGAQTAASRPAGWGEVETSQAGDDIVIAMPAPGLDPDSIRLEPQGSSLQVQAKGSGGHGEHISLNETLALPEGSDPSPATAAYTNGRLVVRIPKSALRTTGG
jgi:HSP20 family molecular chaperone IbpA